MYDDKVMIYILNDHTFNKWQIYETTMLSRHARLHGQFLTEDAGIIHFVGSSFWSNYISLVVSDDFVHSLLL